MYLDATRYAEGMILKLLGRKLCQHIANIVCDVGSRSKWHRLSATTTNRHFAAGDTKAQLSALWLNKVEQTASIRKSLLC